MSLYTCPCCGTGRFHARGCAEVPVTERDRMWDEGKRQPALVAETDALLVSADRLLAATSGKGSSQ